MMQGHFHLVAILLVLAVEPSASFSLPEDASADDPDLDVTLWSTVDLEHQTGESWVAASVMAAANRRAATQTTTSAERAAR